MSPLRQAQVSLYGRGDGEYPMMGHA